MSVILTRRNSRRKINILVKLRFKTFHYKSMIESCLIEDVLFYINRMSHLNSSIPSKIFYFSIIPESATIVTATVDLIKMVTPVDPSLTWMERKGSECTGIVSLLKMIFGIDFQVFNKFCY